MVVILGFNDFASEISVSNKDGIVQWSCLSAKEVGLLKRPRSG